VLGGGALVVVATAVLASGVPGLRARGEQYETILAPEQMVVLPGWSNRLYQANRPLHIRISVQ
jgi:hypothetical protein